MTRTLDRSSTPTAATRHAVRPVMLLTLDVPFDDDAVRFAIETAAETGAELLVCDAVPIAMGNPATCAMRSFGEREARDDLARVAHDATLHGVRATQLIFHNPKPVHVALEVVAEQDVGLLVFGADQERLGRWSFRRATRRIRERAGCLVWISNCP